jgi:hypothetical protein
MAGKRILVKPVERESVQRRHLTPVQFFDKFSGKMVDTGKVSGKTKAKNAGETVRFYEAPGTGKYRTGLEELVTNELKELKPEFIKSKYGLSDSWNNALKEIVKQDRISRQQLYEIKDGVEPNYYTSIKSQSFIGNFESFDPKKPKTFIEKFEIYLYDGANPFTEDTSRGRFAILAIKNAPQVAINKEVANHNYHNFYIAEENEEELEQVKIHDLENDAIYELETIQRKYPESKLYQLAVALKDSNNISLVKGEVAPQIVKAQLNNFIKNKDRNKQDNIAKFLKLAELFTSSPLHFEIEYLTAQAKNVQLIYNGGDGIMYWKGKETNPTVYKWRNEDAFKSFILQEAEKYNPKEKSLNYYSDLKIDLGLRGIIVE